MKTFTINYVQNLGSYLDEVNIEWIPINQEKISIKLKNESELFLLAMNFTEWRQKFD